MDGGGGAQRPVWGGNELKKTGARTRGQNPLVVNNDVAVLFFHRIFLHGIEVELEKLRKNDADM